MYKHQCPSLDWEAWCADKESAEEELNEADLMEWLKQTKEQRNERAGNSVNQGAE